VFGAPQSSPPFRWHPAALVVCAILATPLAAQQTKKPAAKPASPPSSAPAAPASPSMPDAIELANQADLFVQPGNGPLGSLVSGAKGRVLGQSGEWVRVQFEGWVRSSDLRPESGSAALGVSAAEVRADPARYVGKTLDWRLQLVSIQTADELRPEIPAGQPYLLMRGPLPEPGFVYVMLSRSALPRFRALPPLAELTLRLTIRAASTRYLPTPVAELVAVVDSTGR
jgi:hypothetical protein